MINFREIESEIEHLHSVQIVVETYETISAYYIRRIRNSVLQNRAFHDGLNSIFHEIKKAEGGLNAFSPPLLKNNSKTVFVLLTANSGFYGDIVSKTVSLFLERWNRLPVDVAVVGKTGKVLMAEISPRIKYTYFDFPDLKVDMDQLRSITKFISAYGKVTVFHGSFQSFLIQQPVASEISGRELLSAPSAEPAEKYLFEPTLEKVVMFFETEISASLFEQTFHESRLAKLTSRLVLLDRASVKITEAFRKTSFRSQQLRHQIFNRKQLNAMSGVSLWER